ncbi:Scr1 family TA system antitoxin-like transcriptional regulator [Kribbella sp. NPDC056861]|uniref:Scr1 family TA system antitoxin-like transcriptional regulator n=1 Tax=Kribbella sp. NPDC056861 TaxID=3154857 RepID=UPI00342DB69E
MSEARGSTVPRRQLGRQLRELPHQARLTIYGSDPELTQSLIARARETKAKGWWHSYNDVINEDFAGCVGLEAASDLAWYESELIPGLLQTEEYAWAMLTTEPLPSGTRDDETVEAVLRPPVGDGKSLVGQLSHLLDTGHRPNVHIKVMPHSTGIHAGIVSGPFVILRFPRKFISTASKELTT